jgi:lysophospholipase L1-like esterase
MQREVFLMNIQKINYLEEYHKVLYLAGDSTVSSFHDSYYYPRYGYGTQLYRYFAGLNIINLALPGRSSKSFIQETNYKYLVQNIKEDDFLIISFGHNDEKQDKLRYTNPELSLEDIASFQYYLYSYYIKLAIDHGAIPILVTPIVRRNPFGIYTGSYIHYIEGTADFPGGDYPESIRSLGESLKITVIDLTQRTKDLYEKSDNLTTLKYHAWKTANPESVDNTHLNVYGASIVAYLFYKDIQNTDNPLRNYLIPECVCPKEKDILFPNYNNT